MTILAIDIGTTHCKAGLFAREGMAIKIASRPMVVHKGAAGAAYFDADELTQQVESLVGEATERLPAPIAAIGIASMAETGLLVDRRTGARRSNLIPWFDASAQPQANRIVERSDARQVYQKFGLRATFKTSLAKLLWLRASDPAITDGAIWLSAADYLLYRLTGVFATDYSLACRTLAFQLDQKDWDGEWLDSWGLAADLFPPALPGGAPMGMTSGEMFGFSKGIPVSVCGHDHVCAALAAGATRPGGVFDSMGTAEALVGAIDERPLTAADFENGLLAGCHVARGRAYWMGGLSAAGGSVEWFRSLAGENGLSFAELDGLLATATPGPTGILYYPYLLGSGSPHTNPRARAAFLGLSAAHTAGDIFKAILEGVAYEVELIRRAGERMSGQEIQTLIAAGGGTRNPAALQIKADVTGCTIEALAQAEATLQGAALAAGIGCGVYRDEEEAMKAVERRGRERYVPDAKRHARYRELFEDGYLGMQAGVGKLSI